MSSKLVQPARTGDVSEETDVLLWRLEQFQTLGFTQLEAAALTDSDADLGQARQLRKTKCPRELALRILL